MIAARPHRSPDSWQTRQRSCAYRGSCDGSTTATRRRALTDGAAVAPYGRMLRSDRPARRRRCALSPRRRTGAARRSASASPRTCARQRLRRRADRRRPPAELRRVGAAGAARRARAARARRRAGRRRRLSAAQLVGGGGALPRRGAHRRGRESGAADLPRARAALHPAPVGRRGAGRSRPASAAATTRELVAGLRADLPALREVLVARADAPPPLRSFDAFLATPWERAPQTADRVVTAVDADALLMLMYTSGTTADPEGRAAHAQHADRRGARAWRASTR